MELVSGRAFKDGVQLSSHTHTATAKRNENGEISISIVLNEPINKAVSWLEEIPGVRGLIFLWEYVPKKTVFAGFIAIINMIIFKLFHFGIKYLDSVLSIWLVLYFLQQYYLVRSTDVATYHGAEHMVGNAYELDKSLKIEAVKKQSRVREDCGTNFFTLFLVLFIVLVVTCFRMNVLNVYLLNVILAAALAHEVIITENKLLGRLTRPLILLCHFVQQEIMTAQPDDAQLELAIASAKQLESQSS